MATPNEIRKKFTIDSIDPSFFGGSFSVKKPERYTIAKLTDGGFVVERHDYNDKPLQEYASTGVDAALDYVRGKLKPVKAKRA